MNAHAVLVALAGLSAADAPAAPHGQGLLDLLFPLVLVFAIFYFILIRPQQKKLKTHREFIGGLKKGDEVVTDGGILGRITGLTERVAILEISENVKIRIIKDNIAGPRLEEKSEK